MSPLSSTSAPEDDAKPLRVLYVHHVGLLGGSSRSLYEMLRGFPAKTVKAHLVAPGGKLVEMAGALGIPAEPCRGVSQFDNGMYSYYRRFRWLILLRELALLWPTYRAMARAKRRWGVMDVVHINDITLAFAAWLAPRMFPEAAIVVHARIVQRIAETRRKQWIRRLYARNADALIAINENVAESLPSGLPVQVIHNGLEVPAGSDAPATATQEGRPFSVAMVGMLARAKGCEDFIKAAALCRDSGRRIRFLLVGERVRAGKGLRDRLLQWLGLREDMRAEIDGLVLDLNLGDVVVFRPFTADLASIYRDIDVLCFPSYLDAPGRPIFEAGFFGVPSIAAISQPRADTFVSGETGLLVPPGAPPDLARAIIKLHDEPETRARMGAAARRMAHDRFNAQKNAAKVLALYRRLAARIRRNTIGAAT